MDTQTDGGIMIPNTAFLKLLSAKYRCFLLLSMPFNHELLYGELFHSDFAMILAFELPVFQQKIAW